MTYVLSLRPSAHPDSHRSSHAPLSPASRRALVRTLAWSLGLERTLVTLYALLLPMPQFLADQRRLLEVCYNDHFARTRWLERGLERLDEKATQRSSRLLSWFASLLRLVRPTALPAFLERLEKRATRLYRARLTETTVFPTELMARQHFTEASAWHAVHAVESNRLLSLSLAAASTHGPG